MARKQKTIHYLYKTTCNITGRYYIGMHSTTKMDDGYMGSGKRLRYSIRKYGEENHTKEVLELFESRELLIEAEINSITPDMLVDNNCMNIVDGGGGFTSEYAKECVKKSNDKQKILREEPEWVEKKSKAMTKTLKEQWDNGDRTQLPPAFKGEHSEETKKRMSESSKGKGSGENNSQYGKCWITNGKESKKIYKGDNIPDGWYLGRKMK